MGGLLCAILKCKTYRAKSTMWKYGNKKPLDLKKEEKEKFLKYKEFQN